MDLEGVNYIDISPEISESIAVPKGHSDYLRKGPHEPGNHRPSYIQTSLHLGAHADGPIFYDSSGEGIGERSLDYYIGPCQVIDLSKIVGRGSKILEDDIRKFSFETTRILFKTDSYLHDTQSSDYVYFSESAMNFIINQGVKLIGIDTPSVEQEGSRNFEVYKLISKSNMAVLEGLDLGYVEEGKYQLLALPLKIKNGDASPVRAILLPYDGVFNG